MKRLQRYRINREKVGAMEKHSQGRYVSADDHEQAVKEAVAEAVRICESRAQSLSDGNMHTAANEAGKCGRIIAQKAGRYDI